MTTHTTHAAPRTHVADTREANYQEMTEAVDQLNKLYDSASTSQLSVAIKRVNEAFRAFKS